MTFEKVKVNLINYDNNKMGWTEEALPKGGD